MTQQPGSARIRPSLGGAGCGCPPWRWRLASSASRARSRRSSPGVPTRPTSLRGPGMFGPMRRRQRPTPVTFASPLAASALVSRCRGYAFTRLPVRRSVPSVRACLCRRPLAPTALPTCLVAPDRTSPRRKDAIELNPSASVSMSVQVNGIRCSTRNAFERRQSGHHGAPYTVI